MTFWNFAHEHPGAVLVGLFMIVFTVESVVEIVIGAKARKGGK